MIKNPHKDLFIAIEGLDGSGSSTQVNFLVEKLVSQNHKSFITKEPTNNIIGGIIRGQLAGDWKTDTTCLQLLFAADRAHHLEKTILPILKKNQIIISYPLTRILIAAKYTLLTTFYCWMGVAPLILKQKLKLNRS